MAICRPASCLFSQSRSPAAVDPAKKQRVKSQPAGTGVLVKVEMKKQVGRHRTANKTVCFGLEALGSMNPRGVHVQWLIGNGMSMQRSARKRDERELQ